MKILWLDFLYSCRRTRIYYQNPHSRPQSPSFLGHVVGYKLSRVALGDENEKNEEIFQDKSILNSSSKRKLHTQPIFFTLGLLKPIFRRNIIKIH